MFKIDILFGHIRAGWAKESTILSGTLCEKAILFSVVNQINNTKSFQRKKFAIIYCGHMKWMKVFGLFKWLRLGKLMHFHEIFIAQNVH